MEHIDPLIQRMHGLIIAWEAQQDRRAIFLSCYALMTGNMLAAIRAGKFEDIVWVNRWLHRFAGYYFAALQAFDQQQSVPQVWKITFSAARSPQVHILQNLFLGVNAHINYDLVYSLTDLLEPEWPALDNEQRQSRYRDHCYVNKIIAQTIDIVQDQVIEPNVPALEQIDELMGSLDEWLTSRLITNWRDEVWDQAISWMQARDNEKRQSLAHEIEHRSLEKAYAILGKTGLPGLINIL